MSFTSVSLLMSSVLLTETADSVHSVFFMFPRWKHPAEQKLNTSWVSPSVQPERQNRLLSPRYCSFSLLSSRIDPEHRLSGSGWRHDAQDLRPSVCLTSEEQMNKSSTLSSVDKVFNLSSVDIHTLNILHMYNTVCNNTQKSYLLFFNITTEIQQASANWSVTHSAE